MFSRVAIRSSPKMHCQEPIAQILRFAQACFDLQNQNGTRRSRFAVSFVFEKACASKVHRKEMEKTGLLVRHNILKFSNIRDQMDHSQYTI